MFEDRRAGSGCTWRDPFEAGLHGAGCGRVPGQSHRQAESDVNEPDPGDRIHGGPDYLAVNGSRRCSERFPTSRRAVQLDLGYRFLLRLVAPLQ
jgi:hypothetical protein